MRKETLRLMVLVTMTVLLASSAWAAGMYQYEVGSQDTGLASAGYASRAQDASTVFTNPAGMTRLERPEMTAGINFWYLYTRFSPDANTSPNNLNSPDGSPAEHGNASSLIPAPGIFFAGKVSDKVSLGFGVFAFFGGPTEYDDTWVGRYHCINSTLQGITFMPSVAYKVSDKVSVGAGVNAMYTTFYNEVAINNRPLGGPPSTNPDGTLSVQDNEWFVGGKFGVLYELTKGTRFGFTYLTKTRLEFDDVPQFNNVTRPLLPVLLGNKNYEFVMRTPQQFILSGYHELTDNLAVMADIGFEDWQTFEQVNVSVSNETSTRSTTTTAHYTDTWHVALGTQYKLSDIWQLSFGAAYDSSMVSNAHRTPSLPMGQQWRFATGAKYAVSPTLDLGGAYEFIWTGTQSMDVTGGPLSGNVSGQYLNTSMSVLTLYLNWKM